MRSFGEVIPKTRKRASGRTEVSRTPLAIRSRVPLDPDDENRIRAKLGRALGSMGPRIERMTVRLDDVNGPRGGVDTMCRMKVTLSGSDSVLVEQRGRNPEQAVALATPRLSRVVRRSLDRRGGRMPAPTRARPGQTAKKTAKKPDLVEPDTKLETLIGRTAGRHRQNLERALRRPEKQRRDVDVDTAQPGVSATDRRAGGPHTARRNTKRAESGFRAALEDSLAEPSRKSSRRSANRIKSATPLAAREQRRASAPTARHRQGK